MLQSFVEKIKYILTNKYTLSLTIFLLWMTFIDTNSILHQRKLAKEISTLTENRNYYLERLDEIKTNENTIMTDMAKLEKFARENYLMKREDEDLFLVKKVENKNP